mgnify:CR=1 FL=1
MRTYWNTSNGMRTIEEWQPGCWVQVTCPTEEDKNYLESTLHIPDYYISDIADTDERARYDIDDGWVLIIPQASQNAGTVKLCFKTARGGNTVYSIDLPAYEFKAGYRYKYHVKLTSTGVELSLTIADWNERKSSYEIDFNE